MQDDSYFGSRARAAVAEARLIERDRAVAIISKYREQAAQVEPPEERERLLLVLGLIRGEISGE